MKNKNEKTNFFKNKTKLIRTFMFLLCFIFILLLTYVVGTLLYVKDSFYPEKETAQQANLDEYFKDCQLLEADCMGVDCKYYTRCGDESYSMCRVYDCGDTYGVLTQNAKGEISKKNDKKSDTNAVLAKKEACSGDMQVLGDECVDGKEQIKVKIATKGECAIGKFTIIDQNATTQANSFVAAGDGTYNITVQGCVKVSTITPDTPDGISLELNRK